MSAQDKSDHGQTDEKADGLETDETQNADQQATDDAATETEAAAETETVEAGPESDATDSGNADGAEADRDVSSDGSEDPAPAEEPPVAALQQQSAQSGGSGIGWAALIVAVIGSVGAASISSWGPGTIGFPKAPDNADQISALESQISELTLRIDGLNNDLVPALEARLGELEGRPVTDPNALADLSGQIETLAGDIASQADALSLAAEQSEAAQSAGDEQTARLDGLTDRVGGLEGGLANIEGRLSTVQSGLDGLEGQLGETTQALSSIDTGLKANASAVLIVDSVRAAVDQGQPFADLMPDLATLAETTPDVADAVDTLGAHAETGLVPRRDLVQGFPATARAIRTSLRAPEDDSLLSKTLAKVTGLVDVRPSADTEPTQDAAEGGAPNLLAALSEAEASIAGDDLGAALESLGALEGSAAEAAEPWLTDARNFLAADQALDRLRQAALIRLGQGAG